mmetsp:Transcript_48636/g.56131  ORF Transcript_48636/g.56131 Transcript_48636/m.56131 type:complete len:273 (+) Transcript_48636:1-819(+)
MIEDTVLANHFNRTKYSSFIRQLNFYKFKKVPADTSNRKVYYHELFLKGQPALIHRIKRSSRIDRQVYVPYVPKKTMPELENKEVKAKESEISPVQQVNYEERNRILSKELEDAHRMIYALNVQNQRMKYIISQNFQLIQELQQSKPASFHNENPLNFRPRNPNYNLQQSQKPNIYSTEPEYDLTRASDPGPQNEQLEFQHQNYFPLAQNEYHDLARRKIQKREPTSSYNYLTSSNFPPTNRMHFNGEVSNNSTGAEQIEGLEESLFYKTFE